MAKTIGIDLGTTNSVVSFIDGTKVETIPNAEGNRTTPSVVFYKGEEVIVGEIAKRQFMADPSNVVKSIKRIMGKRFEQISDDEQEDLPYKVIQLDDDMAAVQLNDDIRLRPEEVSADILETLKESAENYLGEDVYDVVITVPAHFNDQQRTATKAAAKSAGLNVIRIINEPTAAALAFGLNRDRDGTFAIFDFGGGTFDVSLLTISGDIFEVLSTNGDNQLGGDDVDQILFGEICDRILEKRKIDPTQDAAAVQRIREAAEKLKHDLSTMNSTSISLPFIVADSSGPKHYESEFTREQFNALLQPTFEKLFIPCSRALADAELTVDDIDDVVLVGGSTRIPRVHEMVEEFFGKKPNTSINPDEAVASGAAIQSAVISGDLREVLLLDVTPLTLGIELAGGIFKPMIERNATIPCQAEHKFTTVIDNQKNILVRVLQGERRIAKENHFLAEFRLIGILDAPKEIPEVQVTFSIDANGILEVIATDMITGLQTNVVVEQYGNIGVSEDEIKRHVEDAEANVEKDEDFIRFSESRSKALLIQDKVNVLFEVGGEILSERHMKILKESVFKLDLAMDKLDTISVQTLCDKIKDILVDYQNNPDLDRAMRQHDELHSGENQMPSASELEPVINQNLTPSSFEDMGDIEAELKALMDDADAIASAVESGEMMEQDIARKKIASEEKRKEIKEKKQDDVDSTSQKVSNESDAEAPADELKVEEKETQKNNKPASFVPGGMKKKAESKEEPEENKKSRSFAFAPPKVEYEDPEEDDEEFDISAPPPPPPPG